ncbi:cyclin-D5-3 isoform X2 [Phoenix dactylifera]|uniref:Cyclin-D5-3 isoform X2 n=1 Tax=Phoenix dactylifera TaxID=42345 RepID=A0A8B7BX30_PHODC|nr:cyclin-D5-3 isoform X2 [Phoenix dactylifera]
MGDSDCSVSLSNLICQEDGTSLLLGDDGEEARCDVVTVYNDGCILSETEEDDYIEMLVSEESGCFHSRTHDESCEDWLKCARSDAIRWILKTTVYFGFCSKTAYMAVTYLDRFLIRRTIDDKRKTWAVQLLSVACLSLAAKMEECKVPALSEFRLEEYDFNSNAIQRMEFLVLNTLEWRLSSATPFAYLGYFASKLQEQKSNNFMAKATGFVFAATRVINLVDYRPSVIAAAAVLAAFDERLTQKLVEFEMRTISLCGSLQTEHVLSCYRLMIQESHKEALKPSRNLFSSDLSAANCVGTNSSSVDANDTTSFTARSSKRRRLESPHAE